MSEHVIISSFLLGEDMKYLLFCLIMGCWFLVPFAAASDKAPPDLKAIFAKHRHEIHMEGVQLKGPGGTWLVDQAGAARFVVIGETHNRRELPAWTTALFTQIHKQGFEYLAIENGPYTTRELNRLAKAPDGLAASRTFLQQFLGTYPFYDHVEEFQFLQAVARLSKAETPLWGIDQEYYFSTRYLFHRLAELAKKPEVKTAFQTWFQKEQQAAQHFLQTGEDDQFFFSRAAAADFEALAKLAAKEKNPEIDEILFQLKKSWEIYWLNQTRDYYNNNRIRADFLKTNFARHVAEAAKRDGKPPKAMIKTGEVHGLRGTNTLSFFDVGNMAQELAAFYGDTSFHVRIRSRKMILEGEDDWDWVADIPEHAPFDAPQDKAWIFDLASIRADLWRLGRPPINPKLQKMVSGYDALLLVPVFHQAKEIVPLPR